MISPEAPPPCAGCGRTATMRVYWRHAVTGAPSAEARYACDACLREVTHGLLHPADTGAFVLVFERVIPAPAPPNPLPR